MTKMTREDVLKLARLSQLELSETEVDHLGTEISAILGYIDQLQRLDLDDEEPTNQVTGLKNVTRPDEVQSYGPSPEDLLRNAPATEQSHFRVKRMVQ